MPAALAGAFAVDRAGLVGADGETHHGVFDLAMLRHIPNMTVMMPKNCSELEQMLEWGVRHSGPVALRYPRGACQPLPVTLSGQPLQWGRGEVLRDGRDVAIIGLGPTLALALQAQAELHNRGISAAVLNPGLSSLWMRNCWRSLRRRCGRLLVVEDTWLPAGWAALYWKPAPNWHWRPKCGCWALTTVLCPTASAASCWTGAGLRWKI